MGKRMPHGIRVRPAVALIVGSLLVAAPMVAKSAPRGAECQLAGSATLSPGLTTAKRAQTVTFSSISLTRCLAGNSGAPGIPKFTTASAAISPNPASGTGSCAQSALKNLSATIYWSDGTTTTVTFSTTSVTGATAINGKVSGGSNPNLKPADLVAGAAVFKPAKTSMNCATVPVTAVTFSGVIGAGSPK